MPKGLLRFPVVYKSLEQVITALKQSEVSTSAEVRQLFKICSAGHGILDPQSFDPIKRPISVIKPKLPFIVMEGLDGSGKTKVSTAVSEKLKLERMVTPPPKIKFLKEFFDEQRESIRRAYYSVGNYLVAQEIAMSKGTKGIFLDRYWHSTACYAVAQQKTMPESDPCSDLPINWHFWPEDLLKPQLTFFLVVSEKIRHHRWAVIRKTTNTKEEQALASNPDFRQTLIDSYRKVDGVRFMEVDADPDVELITLNVLDILLDQFPVLGEQ